MPNNFRLEANYFISKAGNDNNAGNDPNAPWASINKGFATRARVVVGTGVYKFTVIPNIYTDQFIYLADGTVKLIGDSATRFFDVGGSQGCSYTGFYFDKFGGFSTHGIYAGPNNYDRCIMKVISDNAASANSKGSVDVFTNCVLINWNGEADQWKFKNCLFFNCTITNCASLAQCYLDPTTSIKTGNASQCNVDPRAAIGSNYGLSINGGSFGYTSTGGVSGLPQFNSLAREDWSLQKNSPHIALGIGPAQYRYSNTCFLEFNGTPGDFCNTINTQLRFAGSGSVVRLKAITTSPDALTFNNQGGMVRISNSNGNGYSQFVTQRIPFSDISQEVTVINIFAGLNIDTDAVALESQISLAAPSPYNNNAPDYNNWSSGSAGRNPNRLTFRARWSTLIDPDVDNPDHWVSGASFIEFEWGSKPTWIQSQLLGNGNPAFNPNDSAAVGIVARFLQIEVTIRDNYFSK